MEEGLLKIFADYLEDVDYLEPEHKNMLMQMGTEEKGRIPFLYDCFRCMDGLMEKAVWEEKEVFFHTDSMCYLLSEQQEIVLERKDARELLAKMIDLFEPIYPLGTVVALKEEFSKSLKLKEPFRKVKVVIVERFAKTKDKQTYFPYVGVVYPIGVLEKGQFINFTSALIDSVVQEGYRDEMEDAYILLMKKELLLDDDVVSFGFLGKEKAAGYAEEIGGITYGDENV